MNSQSLLVTGAPRSGTTLLASLVGAHSRVGMVSEDFYTTWRRIAGKPIVGNKLCIPRQIELDSHSSRFTRLLSTLHLGQNLPRSVLSIRQYIEDLDAKILAIRRDQNPTVQSMIKRGTRSISEANAYWSRAEVVIKHLATKYPDKVLVVKYNELTSKPRNVLTEVCSFLSLGFEESMLEGASYNPNYRDRHYIQPAE